MKSCGIRYILTLILVVLLSVVPQDLSAQSKTKKKSTKAKTTAVAKTTPRKKSATRAEYEKQQQDLKKQISATEKMISDNTKSVRSQSRDIKLREQEIGKRRALLVSMHKEIDAIAQEEDSLQNVISDLQVSYEARKQKYGLAMRHMYKWRSGYDELLFILSSKNMTESIRRIRYLRQYSEWRKSEAEALEAERLETEATKEELGKTREDRQNVLNNIDHEKSVLTKKQEQQELALANLKKKGKELQAELLKDQKQEAEIERKIQQMIEEERRKAEEERRKAEEAARRKAASKSATASSSKNSNASTKSSTSTSSSTASSSAASPTYSPSNITQLTGSFRANKGRLPYPVNSNYAFMRHYKEKNDGSVGITLSTAVGASACCVFEGTVLRCSRSSEDWTIIISHGEYMSVYSNLSSCNVKVGQKVKMRQVLGSVKTDVDGKRGELMFWIYSSVDAENPERWLRQ